MNLNITIDKLVLHSSDDRGALPAQLEQLGAQLGQQLVQQSGLKSQQIPAIQVQSPSGISGRSQSTVCGSIVRSMRVGGKR